MLKKFISDSLIYLVPSFLSKISGFILLLIYVRNLSVEEYGIAELILITFSLLNMILPLEITQGVARYFREIPSSERYKIVSTSCIFTGTVFLLPILASFLIFLFYEDINLIQSINSKTLILISAFMFFCSLQRLIENQLRWSIMPKEYGYLSIFGFISLIIFAWYFVYILKLNLIGFIFANLLSSALSVFFGFYLLSYKFNLSLTFDKKILTTLLNFSYPLVFSSAAFYIFSYSDRWMLQFYESAESVGLYGSASRIAILTATLHILLRSAFMPLVYDNYKKGQTRKDISSIFTIVTMIGIVLVSFISLFSKELVDLILGEDYALASSIVATISISLILVNSYFYAPGLSIAKKTKLIAAISFICAGINIIGNFILIPVFSLKGAAYSSVIASFSLVALYFYFGQKEYKIEYQYKSIFLMMILWIIFVSFINFFTFSYLSKISFLSLFILVTILLCWNQLKLTYYTLNKTS